MSSSNHPFSGANRVLVSGRITLGYFFPSQDHSIFRGLGIPNTTKPTHLPRVPCFFENWFLEFGISQIPTIGDFGNFSLKNCDLFHLAMLVFRKTYIQPTKNWYPPGNDHISHLGEKEKNTNSKVPHFFWAIYYKSLTWFKGILGGFPY